MVHNRKNSFEFFGYDFMVDEQLKVWLIEVNSSPSMETKTQPVLSSIVKSVLRDLAKVVIDCRKNKGAEKGDFIVVHKGKTEVVRRDNNKYMNYLKVDGHKASVLFPTKHDVQQIKADHQPVYGGQPILKPKIEP
jgi:hypothetical protein